MIEYRNSKGQVIRRVEAIAPKAQAVESRVGYVYFVEAIGLRLVKIGFSMKHPSKKRLKDLNGTSPVPLRLIHARWGSQNAEKAFHVRFAHLRVRGEWFRLEGELQSLFWRYLDFDGSRAESWAKYSKMKLTRRDRPSIQSDLRMAAIEAEQGILPDPVLLLRAADLLDKGYNNTIIR